MEKAKEADGFVFGSPVHYASASGALTSFMDRAFYADLCGGRNRFLLKPAAAVVSARRAGTTATWDQVNKYFALMQMPIISSRYWNIVHGATPEQVKKDLGTLTRNGGCYKYSKLRWKIGKYSKTDCKNNYPEYEPA